MTDSDSSAGSATGPKTLFSETVIKAMELCTNADHNTELTNTEERAKNEE